MSESQISENVQDEVLSFLLSAPSLEQVIAFHASERAQARASYLLEANRNGTLADNERLELEEASLMNHIVILLKAKAREVLKNK